MLNNMIKALNKIKYLSLLIVFIVFLSACSSAPVQPPVKKVVTVPPGKILFFSKTCPHCAVVEQYISENNVQKKVYFVKRDITSDSEAYDLMPVIGQRCGIVESNLGVPLFWDGNKCYSGSDDIINYFNSLP